MKARIIRAFLEEIQDTSFKFTMDDLARRLGISKRTLYEHFSSKSDILDALIDSTLREIDDKTAAILENPDLTLIEKIRNTITVIPKYHEFFNWQTLDQMRKSFPEQWHRVNEALNEWDELRGLIEQGIEEGLIADQDVSLLIKIVIDATNSTLDRQFFLKHHVSVSEALDAIVDVLLFGFIKEK